MKRILTTIIIGISLFTFSCKEEEPVLPQPQKQPLIGVFEVPDNKNITFTMSNTDGFATVEVNHEGKHFTLSNTHRMKELNLIVTSGNYYVRVKTYAKGSDTNVSYFLADSKESNIIYGYVGVLKRIK